VTESMSEYRRLFMFGFERSGTTLLSMMVGAHAQIAVPLSTTGLWYRYAERVAEYRNLADEQSVARIVADLLDEKRIQMWDVDLRAEDILPRVLPGSYASIVDAFHQLYAESKGKHAWSSMDISTLYRMERANEWFPSARFLQIVRDGRDVALSHETYKYGIWSTSEVASRWANDVSTSIRMGAMIGPARYKIIRYEDLVLEPEKTLRDICSYAGVEYDDGMLNYPRMVEKKVPPDRRFLWPELSEPPKRSKTFRWKRKMSETKRIVFESRAKRLLDELDYETFAIIPKSILAQIYDFWCYLGEGGRIKRLRRRLRLTRH